MSLPMMKKILYIDNGLELHQANPSPVRKSIFTKGNAGALCKGVGIDVMKNALSQIFKSPFTRGIEKAKLLKWFH